jgi:transcriptional regulator GlxA family with amidase domain
MSKGSSPTIDRAVQRLPTRFGFLLIDDFTLISMSSAIETLRMANRLSGEDIYTWKTVSESGEAVCASDGLCIQADCGIEDHGVFQDIDAIIVCGGRRVEKHVTEPILRWLKKAAKSGLQPCFRKSRCGEVSTRLTGIVSRVRAGQHRST